MNNKASNEFGFRRIWRIRQISEGVKGQALRRERNKVEVLEGKFRSLRLFFVPKKEKNFYMSHV